jgi:hypothetical protein
MVRSHCNCAAILFNRLCNSFYKRKQVMADINLQDDHFDVLRTLMMMHSVRYIVIQTKYTKSHLVRTTYRDRERWKWIVETKQAAFDEMHVSEEARLSRTDSNDLFPRLYFIDYSFVIEFKAWLASRQLIITDIEAPKI